MKRLAVLLVGVMAFTALLATPALAAPAQHHWIVTGRVKSVDTTNSQISLAGTTTVVNVTASTVMRDVTTNTTITVVSGIYKGDLVRVEGTATAPGVVEATFVADVHPVFIRVGIIKSIDTSAGTVTIWKYWAKAPKQQLVIHLWAGTRVHVGKVALPKRALARGQKVVVSGFRESATHFANSIRIIRGAARK